VGSSVRQECLKRQHECGYGSDIDTSIVEQHDTQFTIVVNPSNGPEEMTWPAATYIDAVKRMNKFSNVRTLGYIDTANGRTSNATVRNQIATYAGWKSVGEGLTLSGVYFDHTPWRTMKIVSQERTSRT